MQASVLRSACSSARPCRLASATDSKCLSLVHAGLTPCHVPCYGHSTCPRVTSSSHLRHSRPVLAAAATAQQHIQDPVSVAQTAASASSPCGSVVVPFEGSTVEELRSALAALAGPDCTLDLQGKQVVVSATSGATGLLRNSGLDLVAHQSEQRTLANGRLVLHAPTSIGIMGSGSVRLERIAICSDVHAGAGAYDSGYPSSEAAAVEAVGGVNLTLESCVLRGGPGTLLSASSSARVALARCTLSGGITSALITGGAQVQLQLCTIAGYSQHGLVISGANSSARVFGCRLMGGAAAADSGLPHHGAAEEYAYAGVVVNQEAEVELLGCSLEGHGLYDLAMDDGASASLRASVLGRAGTGGVASIAVQARDVTVSATECELQTCVSVLGGRLALDACRFELSPAAPASAGVVLGGGCMEVAGCDSSRPLGFTVGLSSELSLKDSPALHASKERST